MYPEELKKNISKGNISPLYFFYGENTHLIDKAILNIISSLFPSRSPELDLNYFDAQTHAPSEIIQSANTVPFVSRKRLVVVKRTQAFKDAQWKIFQSFFSKPSACCCLVLISENQGLKGKLLKIFQKNGVMVSFANPKSKNQIKEFIMSGFDRFGKKISADALNYFADNIGGDALTITSELEKTALFCREKKLIDVEDLEAILSGGHTTTVFNLVDEVGRGNIERSLLFLNNLLADGVHPLVIIKMITRQLRLISRAGEGVSRGDSALAIGKKLNLRYDNLIRGIILQSRGWTAVTLGRAFEEVFQSNFLIKSSRINSRVILETLVFRLIGFRDQASA